LGSEEEDLDVTLFFLFSSLSIFLGYLASAYRALYSRVKGIMPLLVYLKD